MSAFAFRVTVTGQQASLDIETGPVPDGVYQVSGHDNRDGDNASQQIAITVVQHDSTGQAVVGATGYIGA